MTHNLRDGLVDELDRLDVLPDQAPSTLQRGRMKVRRSRAGFGVVAALAVIGGATALTLGGGTAGDEASDPGLVATQPAALSPSTTATATSADYRARYPTQAAIADCLAGKGQEATLTRDGALMVEFAPGEDQSDYNAAYAACQIEITGSTTGLLPKNYTQANWRSLYNDERDAAQCLRAHGQTVPAIPSFQEFKATYQTKNPWMAHQFVINQVSQGEWTELVWACPQPEILAQ